jgi:exopolyphosphatase/guanosine-5'-triphosphate,3'-diphosphate pyrophosphatase
MKKFPAPTGAAAPVLAAVDVGTSAVRLEMARPLPDGALELVHSERDPVRPGEGVFKTGAIPRDVADRLLSTLRRYGALCRRHHAVVRAVATSAIREAANREEIIRRARTEAGLVLEVVSGKEEARLICLGVLRGKPKGARSLCIDIGGGSTEIASAIGDDPQELHSIALGAVRLTEVFRADSEVTSRKLKLMRGYAEEAVGEALGGRRYPRTALGSSGTIKAVVSFAAAEGTAHATGRQITKALERLAEMSGSERREHFDPRRADIVVAGAVILEAVVKRLGIEAITAVERGLRDGVLVDLMRRVRGKIGDPSLADAALDMGRRFYFDEPHADQVKKLALVLFDDLAQLHRLPASARPYLEVAALLHDVGNAVSYAKHHRHAYYLIQNADLPGLADRERELVALVARFHRRRPPDPSHEMMHGLSPSETRVVRKLSMLLRVADALDRSHHQPVRRLRAHIKSGAVELEVRASVPVDLELWDLEQEIPLFRRVFAKKLVTVVGR